MKLLDLIPKRTQFDWKRQNKNNWRYKIFNYIKNIDFDITDTQITINQRTLALRCVFGENMEYYKFEVLDTVFKKNPDFLKVNFEDCERDTYVNELRSKILNELENMDLTKDVKSAMYLINKADCREYFLIIQEYIKWKDEIKD